jgi:hypothetical protein
MRIPLLRVLMLSAVAAGLLTTACDSGSGAASSSDPSAMVLLESLPIDPDAIDFAAMTANRSGRESDWLPFVDFGQVFPPTVDRPQEKTNPQPTFYAPLGTPVLAVATGTIYRVTKLYSNDTSVMISAGGPDSPLWEMEHVIKVRVQAGDHVTAGDTIAEVSDYECAWGRNSNPSDPLCASGLGLVEIGLLYGGNPPEHRCPFEPALVAESRRSAIFAQLDSTRKRIEAAFGDTTKYDETARATRHCVTTTRVPG